MDTIICDLDGTLTINSKKPYQEKDCNQAVKNSLHRARSLGMKIIIFTARNMRTFDGDIEKITENTLPIIKDWLLANNVPYDEIIIGKPWCGMNGFYVDDRALRPSEFSKMSIDEIQHLLAKEKFN